MSFGSSSARQMAHTMAHTFYSGVVTGCHHLAPVGTRATRTRGIVGVVDPIGDLATRANVSRSVAVWQRESGGVRNKWCRRRDLNPHWG